MVAALKDDADVSVNYFSKSYVTIRFISFLFFLLLREFLNMERKNGVIFNVT